MKPRPRIREAVKWGGAVATALLLSAWLASRWWRVASVDTWSLYAGRNTIERTILGAGLLVVRVGADPAFKPPTDARRSWQVLPKPRPMEFRWWFGYTSWPGGGELAIPIWALAACVLVPTATAWRLDALAHRRARANHCPKCGYDRRGLDAASPCPECGESPAGDTLKA